MPRMHFLIYRPDETDSSPRPAQVPPLGALYLGRRLLLVAVVLILASAGGAWAAEARPSFFSRLFGGGRKTASVAKETPSAATAPAVSRPIPVSSGQDQSSQTSALRGESNSVERVPPRPACGLEEALDTAGLVWITRGSGAPWCGRVGAAFDGVDAAQVGPLAAGEQSWLETVVNGPGVLSFWWRVSSEPKADGLRFFLDGVEQAKIAGESGWQEARFHLPFGAHGLRWIYTRNSRGAQGEDRAWLDQVQFQPEIFNPGIAFHPCTGGWEPWPQWDRQLLAVAPHDGDGFRLQRPTFN